MPHLTNYLTSLGAAAADRLLYPRPYPLPSVASRRGQDLRAIAESCRGSYQIEEYLRSSEPVSPGGSTLGRHDDRWTIDWLPRCRDEMGHSDGTRQSCNVVIHPRR